jgi:hypothetical protein
VKLLAVPFDEEGLFYDAQLHLDRSHNRDDHEHGEPPVFARASPCPRTDMT